MPESLPEIVAARKITLENFIIKELLPLEGTLENDREAVVPETVKKHVRHRSKSLGIWDAERSRISALELTVLRETLSKYNLRLSRYVFGPGAGILSKATGRLKEEYASKVLSGEKVGSFGFTEPDNVERMTFAVTSPDNGTLTITGQKSYVTGGSTADFVVVLANVKASDGTPQGTAMIVIDRKAPGVTIEREFFSMDGGLSHAFMRFSNVEVPMWHVVGKIGEGMPRALGQIGNVRLALAAESVGLCIFIIDFIEQHLQAPHRSGSPLGSREGVRLRLADLRIKVFAARSMLYRTARLVDSGEDASSEVIATKVFSTEVAGYVIDTAVQLVGGNALIRGHPLEFLYRKLRSSRLTEGASDLLRINLSRAKLEKGRGRL